MKLSICTCLLLSLWFPGGIFPFCNSSIKQCLIKLHGAQLSTELTPASLVHKSVKIRRYVQHGCLSIHNIDISYWVVSIKFDDI
jgi:hypothetical protein